MLFRVVVTDPKDKTIVIHEIEFNGNLNNLWRRKWFSDVMYQAMLLSHTVTINRSTR